MRTSLTPSAQEVTDRSDTPTSKLLGQHEEAARWAAVCSGSGHCIPACTHGINPRFMLTMARLAAPARQQAAERRQNGFANFGKMTASVRVLSRLQLPPDLIARFRPEENTGDPPEVVFYTGCNLMKTPHIALLCLDILDAMGVRYRVNGGPSQCCGVLQLRAGDLATAGRIAHRTIKRLSAAAPRTISRPCQIVSPPGSTVPVPGAKAGSRLSMS